MLLEPIVNIEVTVPQDNVGDITGDRRAAPRATSGQDMLRGNLAVMGGRCTGSWRRSRISSRSARFPAERKFRDGTFALRAVPSNEAAAVIAQKAAQDR